MSKSRQVVMKTELIMDTINSYLEISRGITDLKEEGDYQDLVDTVELIVESLVLDAVE